MASLRLLDTVRVGEGQHRGGWPAVLDTLAPLCDPDGPVLLDDFVERTFLYRSRVPVTTVHSRPWVGMLHHPPGMPDWYLPYLHLDALPQSQRFMASLPHCRLLVVFCPEQADWVRRVFPDVPVEVLRHPGDPGDGGWTAGELRDGSPAVMQIGWFLRDTAAIYALDAPVWLRKVHLRQPQPWLARIHEECLAASRARPPRGHTEQRDRLADALYDVALSSHIVFLRLYAAAANNAVVECLARRTPLVINRLAATRFYLGDAYPLFYDELDDAGALLDPARIEAAHAYLVDWDPWWLRREMFMEHLIGACDQWVPELRGLRGPATPSLYQ